MQITSVTTAAELNECLRIRKEVFVREQQVPEEIEVDEFDASPAACHHILASKEGAAIGTGRWREYKPGTAKLQRVAVLAEHRGRGVGKQLIAALEESAAAAGMTVSILDGQCHAEKFYQRLGYETVSRQPFEEAGIMHVRMQKILGAES